MIYGNMKNLGAEYKSMPAIIKKAIDYLRTTDISKLENKKNPVKGFNKEEVFAMISEYETKPAKEAIAEQHRKFAEVHFLAYGEESIGVGFDNPANKVSQKYSEENDCILYADVMDEIWLTMRPGNYAVFFPEDIHRPRCNLKEKSKVKKAVLKMAVHLV